MATSADLNWEENLAAHWMSDASRAGVILNPMFPNMKITRANSFENAPLSLGVHSLYSSRSSSLSEDSLHKGQAFRLTNPCEEMLDGPNILFPNSLAKQDHVAMVQEAPATLLASQTDPECDEFEDIGENHCSDQLLQKLEQLKGVQQHKQEQLRRQQMDQIQKLMEEQQKLLSRVSGQQTHSGFTVTEDGMNQRYVQPTHLFPVPYLPSRCHDDSAHLDSVSCISSPTERRDSLEKLKNGQALKGSLSEKDMPFKAQDGIESEDRSDLTGENNWSPEQNSLACGDGDVSCEWKAYTESSKRLAAGKCSGSLNAEERPLLATIEERKQTFEEFLEEQIQLEEQRLSQKGNVEDTSKTTFQKPVAKHPFLKRGEGLSRFTNAKSRVAKQKESKVSLHPDISEVSNSVKANKLQLHRKTAPSNKDQVSDNVVPKEGCQNAKMKKGFTARKRTVFRKGIPLSARENPNERKPGELRKSIRSQINDENNKENVTAPVALNEIDILPGEKPEHPLKPARCLTDAFEEGPDFSFELSFQRKLENWDTEKEKEKNELDEFLFLEQAADEISFASNSSLIVRILDQGQHISTGHRLSSTPVKSRPEQMHVLDITAVNSRNGEWYVSQDNNERTRATVVGCQSHESLKNHQNKFDSKISQAFPTEGFQDFRNPSWDDEDGSDSSSDKTSESEEEFETTIKPVSERPKNLALKYSSDYKIPELSEYEGKAKDPNKEASPDLQGKNPCSCPANEISKDPISENICCGNSNDVEFGDETTWSDFEEHGNQCNELENSGLVIKVPLPSNGSAKNELMFPDKVIKRKVAMVKKGEEVPHQNLTDDGEVTAPPTTDLMLKLFPALKPKQKVDAPQKHDAKPNTSQEESGDSARSQILKDKLVQLETEIERFRVENASLTKLREERENAMVNLRKEIADFEQQKVKELAQIEDFKKEEVRKLQKERKVFEKYAQAARAIPDKKERDEIQALKQQMATLQGDLKRREAKWSTTHMRLRDQIEALTKENLQLREEIKIMERCRLEAWKRKEASANKKKTDSSYAKRAESIHSSAILQKSQTFSSAHQTEKNSKMNGKCDPPSEEKTFAKPKPSAVHKDGSSDNSVKPFEDSSRNFMVVSKNLPASGIVDSASIVTPDTSDGEHRIVEGEATHPDGKVEKLLKNGSHLIIFPNGTRKEVSYDGKITTVSFFNGDIKQILEDQRVVYYYADAKTTHTTYPTGLEVLHFSNGQIEKHFPDGRKEIVFPDQTIKNVFTDGREVNIFPDGTIVHIQQDGSRMIEFNNGQQEMHTAHFKRREYPDGTIKTVYVDGRQETQYASGRVRVKDKDGNVIMDTLP
ncbi:centromere protein J isoform X2 [Anolis carolinensis]|uniref:centromere protein J isoform X2 n=1 Tax=Anolis carolinensis TaxID=28377 RepID=UPI002F2B5676